MKTIIQRFINTVLLLLVLTVIHACVWFDGIFEMELEPRQITIHNNTDFQIVVVARHFQDVQALNELRNHAVTIDPMSSYVFYELEKIYNSEHEVRIYVMSLEVVNNNDWEDVIEKRMFLVTYDVSGKYLKKTQEFWEITQYHRTLHRNSFSFPPSEAMSELHMEPPYEEVVAKYGQSAE